MMTNVNDQKLVMVKQKSTCRRLFRDTDTIPVAVPYSPLVRPKESKLGKLGVSFKNQNKIAQVTLNEDG
jgi:hypothetical protein